MFDGLLLLAVYVCVSVCVLVCIVVCVVGVVGRFLFLF